MAQKLALQWSPGQISGWLKQEFPTHQDMQISHEAIYRSLFIQTRGVLKKELTAQLRTARRAPRATTQRLDRGIKSTNAVARTPGASMLMTMRRDPTGRCGLPGSRQH